MAGAAGVVPPVDLGRHGLVGMYTSGSCAAGYGYFAPGPRAVVFLDLGAATQLGGTLTLTTCGHTASNTVLYVGTGCPSWAVPFNCRVGNDNGGDDAGGGGGGGAGVSGPPCAANAGASTIVLRGVATRNYFVQLGGYLGAPVMSGLGWAYAPPASATASRSGTRSRSRTRSRTASASRTQSRSASGSRSRKRK